MTQAASHHVQDSEEFERWEDEERECFKETFEFLKAMAQKLKRGQSIINTSMVFFLKYTRIYPCTSINKFLVASACLLLGAKVRNEPVPTEYLVEWYIYFESKRTRKAICLDISPAKKEEYGQRIQEQEFEILCDIGFDFEVDLPNKHIAQFLNSETGKKIFSKSSWNQFAYMFMNDSFMTTSCLYHPPQVIAAAVIYMASTYLFKKGKIAESLQLVEEGGDEWYKVIDESLVPESIIEVKDQLKKCYVRKPTSA